MLDAYNQQLLLEAVGIPNQDSVLVIDGAFATGKTLATGAIQVTRDLVFERLAALPVDVETRLVELLVEWKEVSTSHVSISPNNANEGVRLNPAVKRRILRARIKQIVGLVLQPQTLGGGAAIPVG